MQILEHYRSESLLWENVPSLLSGSRAAIGTN
jgi:hypothetical protein